MTAGVTSFPGALDDKTTLLEASNRFQTTLDGALTDIAASMTVVSTTGAPSAGALTIDDERIFYTGKTGTTFTGLLRGQDGSSAAAHSNGATVEGRVIARHVNVLQDAIIALETLLKQVAAGPPVVLNGSFDVWQRGPTFTGIADSAYCADGWRYTKIGAVVHDISRSTSVPAVAAAYPLQSYSLLLDVTTVDSAIAAGDVCGIAQRIEGFRWRGLAQRQFTLSFWVSDTKTGVHCVAFQNSGGDRSYVAEYTVSQADTWEYKTITVSASPSAGTWDYTTGVGLELFFTLAAGSNFHTTASAWQSGDFLATANQVNAVDSTANNFRLAMVQLDPGSSALPYRPIPFHETLQLCQRYYCKTFPYGTAPAQSGGNDGALGMIVQVAGTAGASRVHWYYPVPMRAAPTVTTYNPGAANANWRNTTDGADSGVPSVSATGERMALIDNPQVAADGVQDVALIHATASAEL